MIPLVDEPEEPLRAALFAVTVTFWIVVPRDADLVATHLIRSPKKDDAMPPRTTDHTQDDTDGHKQLTEGATA